MQLMEGAPNGSAKARAFAGTCPDCMGDLGVTPIEDGWVLGCTGCGATVPALDGVLQSFPIIQEAPAAC